MPDTDTTLVPAAQEAVDKLLTVDEAADFLRLGRAKLYRLMRAGELDYVTVGARRRVRMSAIERYLSSVA